MSLETKINDDIKSAMLAKEKTKLESLRAVKAAILLAKTAGGASGEVTDAEVLKIIQKLVKQRRESAEIYKQQNRPELADVELAEAGYIEAYMPAQMSQGELETALKEIIAGVGASAPSDMGKVMGVASKQLSGKADGRAISETVKKLLAE